MSEAGDVQAGAQALCFTHSPACYYHLGFFRVGMKGGLAAGHMRPRLHTSQATEAASQITGTGQHIKPDDPVAQEPRSRKIVSLYFVFHMYDRHL